MFFAKMKVQIKKEKTFQMKTRTKLKRTFMLVVSIVLCCLMAVPFLTGCGGEKNILVVSREASSGTREAFDKYVGLSADDLIDSAEELGSTGLVKTKVASVESAIGYISLASLDDSVKALNIDGVKASADTVRDGSYKIQRPFLLLTSKSTTLSETAQDFFNYCASKSAESAITEEGGVTSSDFDSRSEYVAPATALSGEIKLVGSTSMEDMVLALVKSYQDELGYKAENISFSFSFNGSSEGRTAVKNDTDGTTIGLASSSKTDDAYSEFTFCLDAVAVIVNKNNDQIDNVTKEQLKSIYTGEIVKFSEVE